METVDSKKNATQPFTLYKVLWPSTFGKLTRRERKIIICSEMAGAFPLATEGHIIIATLLLVTISCQLGVFGAPVPQTPLSTQEGSQTARKLLQWAIEHSFPTHTLSTEVRYHAACFTQCSSPYTSPMHSVACATVAGCWL